MEKRTHIDESIARGQKSAVSLEKAFAFLLGKWACIGSAVSSHLGPAHAIRSSFDMSLGIGGSWLVLRCIEERTAENPTPIEVMNCWGVDAISGRFVRTFHASTGAWGTGNSDGFVDDVLVWQGEIRQRNGRQIPYRQIITRTGADTLHEAFEVLEDGAWRSRGQLDCRRKTQ